MKPTLTDITVLLDRSGSMDIIKNDTIGGFNAFLKTQVESPGEAVLTLAQFDTVYEEVHHAKPIKDVPELNGHTFVPRGGTALYYSLVRLIDETGKRLSEMNEADRPGMVVFVIITDGEENSSGGFEVRAKDGGLAGIPQYDAAAVERRINTQRDVYKWQFVFLGANQDAIAAAGKIGIAGANAMSYGTTPVGVSKAYSSVGSNLRAARTGTAGGQSVHVASAHLSYTAKQRDEQDEEIGKTNGGRVRGVTYSSKSAVTPWGDIEGKLAELAVEKLGEVPPILPGDHPEIVRLKTVLGEAKRKLDEGAS